MEKFILKEFSSAAEDFELDSNSEDTTKKVMSLLNMATCQFAMELYRNALKKCLQIIEKYR